MATLSPYRLHAITLLLLCVRIATAQTLLPYLGTNGLYGLADEQGTLVVGSELERVPPMLPQTLAVNARKDGAQVRVFRNGTILPNPDGTGLVKHLVNYDAADRVIDTLRDRAVVMTVQNITLMDLQSGHSVTSVNTDRNTPPTFGLGISLWTNRISDFHFRMGAARIHKALDKVNFVDTAFREILPKDYAAGLVADAEYFIVAEGEGRVGIADRQGHERVPCYWRHLAPAGKTGYFIVNSSTHYNSGAAMRTGLLRADGHLVIDTAYYAITPVPGGDMLIVRTDEYWGLMDYEGRTILAPTQSRSISALDNGWALVNLGGRYNFINHRGERALAADANFVFDQSDAPPFPHYITQETWQSQVLDANLQPIFQDSLATIHAVFGHPLRFWGEKTIQGKKTHLLKNADHQVLVAGTFNRVWQAVHCPQGYLLLQKADLQGVIGADAAEILPTQFATIVFQPLGKDTLLWGRLPGSNLYVAHHKNGQRVAHIPESEVPSWGQKFMSRPLSQEQKKAIIPADFTLPERVAGLKPMSGWDATGLLVVQQLPNKVPPPAPQSPSAAVEAPRHQTPAPNGSCGVIDGRGNWVMPPRENAVCWPITSTMIVELPLDAGNVSQQFFETGILLHRIHPNIRDTMRVHWVAYNNLPTAVDNLRVGRIRHGTQRQAEYAYFDAIGQQLTPFAYADGPQHLLSRNVVDVWQPDGRTRQAIIDKKGEIIHSLGSLVAVQPPHKRGNPWRVQDFIVEVADAPPYTQMGLMDTLGQLVVPTVHKDLKILEHDAFLSAATQDGGRLLLDRRNQALFTFQGDSFIQCRKLPDGHWLVGNEQQTLYLSHTGEILRTFDYPLSRDTPLPELSAQFAIFLIHERAVWGHLQTGVLWRG